MNKLAAFVLVFLISPAYGGDVERKRDIQMDCVGHAQSFTFVINTAVNMYPERRMTEEILLGYAPQTTPPSAGKSFVMALIDKVYTNTAFRRMISGTGGVEVAESYYQDCLEEPQNYLSDYDSIK